MIRPPRGHFWLDFFACFLIPCYTLLFAGSVKWFSTNFSVIAVAGADHYRGFLYWGILAGSYFFVMLTKLALLLPRSWARLAVQLPTIAACLSLAYALAIPYLPDLFPKYAVLHVALAALSCVLVMITLLVLLLPLRRKNPRRYRRLLLTWGLIAAGCAVIFFMGGMVTSALEVFFTITTVLLVRRLWLTRQSEP